MTPSPNNPRKPNIDAISGALITLSLSILNSQCEEGVRDGIDIWYMGFIIVLMIAGLTCDLSHNDVHEGNCLIDPNQMVDGKSKMEALRLIDFEYSNYGYR